MPTRHLSWLHFHHQPWDPEWLPHSSLPKEPLLHLQPDSFGLGEPSGPVWLTPAGHRPLLQVPPATLSLTYFIFNTGNSTATFSCTKFGKYHASCRDICAHNFLYETWKILIEVINIFRKMNLHFLILRQGCQKLRENGHRKSHLISI